jgi:hypothetical protein
MARRWRSIRDEKHCAVSMGARRRQNLQGVDAGLDSSAVR